MRAPARIGKCHVWDPHAAASSSFSSDSSFMLNDTLPTSHFANFHARASAACAAVTSAHPEYFTPTISEEQTRTYKAMLARNMAATAQCHSEHDSSMGRIPEEGGSRYIGGSGWSHSDADHEYRRMCGTYNRSIPTVPDKYYLYRRSYRDTTQHKRLHSNGFDPLKDVLLTHEAKEEEEEDGDEEEGRVFERNFGRLHYCIACKEILRRDGDTNLVPLMLNTNTICTTCLLDLWSDPELNNMVTELPADQSDQVTSTLVDLAWNLAQLNRIYTADMHLDEFQELLFEPYNHLLYRHPYEYYTGPKLDGSELAFGEPTEIHLIIMGYLNIEGEQYRMFLNGQQKERNEINLVQYEVMFPGLYFHGVDDPTHLFNKYLDRSIPDDSNYRFPYVWNRKGMNFAPLNEMEQKISNIQCARLYPYIRSLKPYWDADIPYNSKHVKSRAMSGPRVKRFFDCSFAPHLNPFVSGVFIWMLMRRGFICSCTDCVRNVVSVNRGYRAEISKNEKMRQDEFKSDGIILKAYIEWNTSIDVPDSAIGQWSGWQHRGHLTQTHAHRNALNQSYITTLQNFAAALKWVNDNEKWDYERREILSGRRGERARSDFCGRTQHPRRWGPTLTPDQFLSQYVGTATSSAAPGQTFDMLVGGGGGESGYAYQMASALIGGGGHASAYIHRHSHNAAALQQQMEDTIVETAGYGALASARGGFFNTDEEMD